MKYFALVVLLVCSVLGGYWYGYSVGFTESRMLAIGGNALSGIRSIEELDLNPEVKPRDLYESRINNALISYGVYLEKGERIAIPPFYTAKPVIRTRFKQIVTYRKNNPRIINGTVYSPFPEGYETSLKFRKLDSRLRKKYVQEKMYYEKAMEP